MVPAEAALGEHRGKCREPQSSKTKQNMQALCKVLSACATLMYSPKRAAEICTKWAVHVIFMEVLPRSVRSIFSAKHRCFRVNMSAPPVLLNKPERVSRLPDIPFCRGPGSFREGSGRACELNTNGVGPAGGSPLVQSFFPASGTAPMLHGAAPGSLVPFMLFSEVMFKCLPSFP